MPADDVCGHGALMGRLLPWLSMWTGSARVASSTLALWPEPFAGGAGSPS